MTLTDSVQMPPLEALLPLTHHQVVQRDSPAGALVPLGEVGCPSGCAVVALNGRGLQVSESGPDDGALWLPTGGPYDIVLQDGDNRTPIVSDVLVGDLWLLGGQ